MNRKQLKAQRIRSRREQLLRASRFDRIGTLTPDYTEVVSYLHLFKKAVDDIIQERAASVVGYGAGQWAPTVTPANVSRGYDFALPTYRGKMVAAPGTQAYVDSAVEAVKTSLQRLVVTNSRIRYEPDTNTYHARVMTSSGLGFAISEQPTPHRPTSVSQMALALAECMLASLSTQSRAT